MGTRRCARRTSAAAVNDLMREHGLHPLASDMGDCLFKAMDMDPTALIAPGCHATMGYGVPAGLGMQAATGRRPLVLVGDGAFQMTGWELGNARRYGWDRIVLVFNNAGWEMRRAFEPGARFNDLERWDVAARAASMGGDGTLCAPGRSCRWRCSGRTRPAVAFNCSTSVSPQAPSRRRSSASSMR